MSGLSAFLAQNAKKVENIKVAVSDRFVDVDGKPIEWEIRCINSKEDEEIRQACQKYVPVPGKRGQTTPQFDSVAYLSKLATAYTVFPNLRDAELQDSYGVKTAEALLATMLTPGEYNAFTEQLFNLCGFNKRDELVEEAKN